MHVKWTPAPYALTLDELCTMAPPHLFLHNAIIYVGLLRCECAAEGIYYLVKAYEADTCLKLLGSTEVIPVTPHFL